MDEQRKLRAQLQQVRLQSRSKLKKLEQVEGDRARCAKHPLEIVTAFCKRCSTGVCVACMALEHTEHETQSLASLSGERYRSMRSLVLQNTSVEEELSFLIGRLSPAESALHKYVDEELESLRSVVERKRLEMQNDVTERFETMKRMLEQELAVCDNELTDIEVGQRVLNCMAAREGLVGGALGGIIHGTLSYGDFIKQVDRPLHDPPKMMHLLGLQLPFRNLQDMCDLVTWTPLSLSSAPQIFPLEDEAVV